MSSILKYLKAFVLLYGGVALLYGLLLSVLENLDLAFWIAVICSALWLPHALMKEFK